MQEQDPRHQKAAMTRTQLAMLMLMGAAFSSLMATIGFAVIKMSWIGNAGLILTLLLVCDAVLLLRNGRSFSRWRNSPIAGSMISDMSWNNAAQKYPAGDTA